ncbi:MAG: hypothetical protein WBB52_10515 [Acidimicrobiales bacterium]
MSVPEVDAVAAAPADDRERRGWWASVDLLVDDFLRFFFGDR